MFFLFLREHPETLYIHINFHSISFILWHLGFSANNNKKKVMIHLCFEFVWCPLTPFQQATHVNSTARQTNTSSTQVGKYLDIIRSNHFWPSSDSRVVSLTYDKKLTILRAFRAVKVLIYLVCVPTLCRVYKLPAVQCFPSVSHGCFLTVMTHSVGKTKMAISKVSNKLIVQWYFTNCATKVDIKEAEGSVLQ